VVLEKAVVVFFDHFANLSALDAWIVVMYLVVTLIIGVLHSSKVKNLWEFSVWDRNYSVSVTVATLVASLIGSSSVMGLCEKVYQVGFLMILCYYGAAINKWFMAKFLAEPIAHFRKAISMGDIMGALYGNAAKFMSGISITLRLVGSMGAQVAAIGFVFNYFFGTSYVIGTIIACGVTTLYAAVGGVRSVVLTDIFQFIITIVVLPLSLGLGILQMGGFENIIASLPSSHLQIIPTKIEHWNIFLVWSFSGMSSIAVQRMLMAKTPKMAKKSLYLSTSISVLVFTSVGIIGLITKIIQPDVNPNLAFFAFTNSVMPEGLKGVMVAGFLAIIMSTADSILNTASVAFVNDVLFQIPRLTERMRLILAKLSTLVFGFGTLYIAFNCKSVLELALQAYIVWTPVVVVPFVAGLLGFITTPVTFFCAAAAGITTVLVFIFFGIGNPRIDAIIPAMLSNCVFFFSSHYVQKYFFGEYFKKATNDRRRAISDAQKSDYKYFIDPPKIEFTLLRRVQCFFSRFGFSVFKWGNILKFCSRHVVKSGAEYLTFSIFGVINYVVPYFMWSNTDVNSVVVLALRIMAGSLCVALMLWEKLPSDYEKYRPAFWYIAVTFCLPFYTTFMVLYHWSDTMWIINATLSAFLLGLLVDWTMFCVSLTTGAIFGCLSYHFFVDASAVVLSNNTTIHQLLYIAVFSIAIVYLFGRKNEMRIQDRLNNLHTISDLLAHRVSAPLLNAESNFKFIARNLPTYVKAYDKAVGARLITPESLESRGNLLTCSKKVAFNLKCSLLFIKSMLAHTQEDEDPTSPDNGGYIRSSDILKEAVESFPMSVDDPIKITLREDKSFILKCNKEKFFHVIINILRNAQEAIFEKGIRMDVLNGEIEIFTFAGDSFNTITVRDNGIGIPEDIRKRVFDRFFTTKSKLGAGLGLYFCKLVVKKIGGTIDLESEEGKFTRFIITLPKFYNDASR
jgi:Na+/proline symporter/signal transduction histidine kinase